MLVTKLFQFDFMDKKFKSMGSETVWLSTLFKIYSCVQQKKEMELHESEVTFLGVLSL